MNMKKKSSTGSRTLVFLITFLSLVVILSTPLASSAGPSGRFNVQDEKFRTSRKQSGIWIFQRLSGKGSDPFSEAQGREKKQ